MTNTINKISIESNELNIEYKGNLPKVIMSYYAQWDIYGANFSVPAYQGAVNDIYDKITHLAYGFMGFNQKGEIGTWDGHADLNLSGTAYYGNDFYKNLPITSNSFPNWGQGYNLSYPLTSQKFPVDSIKSSSATPSQFYRLAYIKHLKPELKIIMSFGGWEYSAAKADTGWRDAIAPAEAFYDITRDPINLNKFVNNIVDIIKNYQFQIIEHQGYYYPVPYITPNGNINNPTKNDQVVNGKLAQGYTRVGKPYNLFSGVDIDWEYVYGCDQCANCSGVKVDSQCPGGWKPSDSEITTAYNGYSSLLTNLKEQLPNPEYFVSSTCAGNPADVNKLVSQKGILNAFKTIDRVSIMTYDFMNGNDYITHDSPLYNQKINDTPWNANAAVNNMIKGGVTKSKINIGIPYYGRFQYITENTLTNLGYKEGVPTTEVTNKIFNGTTKGMYTACKQANPKSITCPWVVGNSIGLNSINYNVTPTSGDNTISICGGDCNFMGIKGSFYEANDTKAGATYYISNNTYTNSDIFNGEESRIILSMPSEYSIQQKTSYVKNQKLGGVITWMVGNDTSFTLANYVYDGLK